jgi:hypothetical protein
MATTPEYTLDFSRLQLANRIVVTTNTNRTLATVVDSQRIADVLSVVSRLANGWGVPSEGVPVAGIRMNFYQDDTLLGNMGLASNFFTALNKGTFWSRTVEPHVYNYLTDLLEVSLRTMKPRPGLTDDNPDDDD